MAGPDASRFFARVRADLADARRRRLAALAEARGLAGAERVEEALRGATDIEQALARAGFSPEQARALLADLDAPARASRYEIGDKLGEGAVSVVHRGADRELGRPVALKFLKEGLVDRDKALERFHREAQSLARMDHPHVVRVHDVGRDGDKLFLVMELVEGEPLDRRFARDRRAVIPLLEQAARGVQHAHEKGVVHRDLKPANILVAAGDLAKVADFGLAHLLEDGPGLTRTGTVLGTPLYMAPEQVRGEGDVSPRTDVYALGAILYHAITGRPPHAAESVSQVYEKILRDDPPPARTLDATAPAALEAVANKALEKDPRRRYPSAAAFADELRRWLEGRPVEARPVSRLARAWRRHRGLALAAGIGLAAALAVGGLWTRGRWRLEEAARLEQEGRPREARDLYLLAGARAEAERIGEELRRAENLLEQARPLLEKDVEAAGVLVDEALGLAGDVSLAHYRHGEVLEARGAYARAAEAFRRAAALDPRSGPARYRLGRSLLWQGYLASLNMWSRPDPADRARAEGLVREGAAEIASARAAGTGFDDELRRDVAAAMLAWARGDREETRRLCAEGVRRHGVKEGVEEFHWLEGLSLPKTAEQKAAYDRALALRPRFPLALYARAWVGGGHADYEAAIRAAPDFAEAHIFLASHRLSAGDAPGALAGFGRLIAMGVHLAPAYNGRAGVKLRLLKDYDGAIADATEAIRLRPDDYHLPWVYRGEARFEKGDWDTAIRDFTRAIDIVPEQAEKRRLLVFRGRARAALGDLEAARRDLRDAGPAGDRFLRDLK